MCSSSMAISPVLAFSDGPDHLQRQAAVEGPPGDDRVRGRVEHLDRRRRSADRQLPRPCAEASPQARVVRTRPCGRRRTCPRLSTIGLQLDPADPADHRRRCGRPRGTRARRPRASSPLHSWKPPSPSAAVPAAGRPGRPTAVASAAGVRVPRVRRRRVRRARELTWNGQPGRAQRTGRPPPLARRRRRSRAMPQHEELQRLGGRDADLGDQPARGRATARGLRLSSQRTKNDSSSVAPANAPAAVQVAQEQRHDGPVQLAAQRGGVAARTPATAPAAPAPAAASSSAGGR